jgi:hypothetical protein
MAAMIHARASQATADAARQNASLGARKYNDEMKWANMAFGNPGGTGQPDNARSRLFDLTTKLDSILGAPGHNPYQFNFNNGMGAQ